MVPDLCLGSTLKFRARSVHLSLFLFVVDDCSERCSSCDNIRSTRWNILHTCTSWISHAYSTSIQLAKESHRSGPSDNGARKPTLPLVGEIAKVWIQDKLEKWEEWCIPPRWCLLELTLMSILAWKIPWTGKAWQASVHAVTKSQIGLSMQTATTTTNFKGEK